MAPGRWDAFGVLRGVQVAAGRHCCSLPRGHRVSPHCAASNALVAELVRPSPTSARRMQRREKALAAHSSQRRATRLRRKEMYIFSSIS